MYFKFQLFSISKHSFARYSSQSDGWANFLPSNLRLALLHPPTV